jgi:hypothetical protein
MDQGSNNVALQAKVSLPANPTSSMSDGAAVDGRSSLETSQILQQRYVTAPPVFQCTVCARVGTLVSEWPRGRSRTCRRGPPRERASPT